MTYIKDNLTAITFPTVGDDSTIDSNGAAYASGSGWFNTLYGRVYRCYDATIGAAKWAIDGQPLDAWPSNTIRYASNLVSPGTGTHAANTDAIVFSPFALERRASVNQLGFYLGALGAGSSMRLGLYDTDPSAEMPGNRLLNSSVIDTSTGSTGQRNASFSSFDLLPGLYWLCAAYLSTATPCSFARISTANGQYIHPTVITNLSTPVLHKYYTNSSAYSFAGGLPTTAPALTPASGSECPIISIRRA